MVSCKWLEPGLEVRGSIEAMLDFLGSSDKEPSLGSVLETLGGELECGVGMRV